MNKRSKFWSFWVIWPAAILLTCHGSEEGIAKIKELGRFCNVIFDVPGWKCDDGTCNEIDYVCDGFQQCPGADDSDESIGCTLFAGKYLKI